MPIIFSRAAQGEDLPPEVEDVHSSGVRSLRDQHEFPDGMGSTQVYARIFCTVSYSSVAFLFCSVADPNPDPPDPRLFGPSGSGSGSISQLSGSGSGSGSEYGSF